MNTQFHTPSFGDEFVDMQVQQQQMQMQSKRVRGMDSSLDEYHSATNESFGNASTPLINCSPPAMMTTTAAPATATTPTTTLAARKQLATTATDPNEPAKPLSAYALFFRDTVSAIKQQNPNCSFQELSRIVASMWEALDPTHKNVYQKKNELARNEYLKQLRVYRQQQLETQAARTDEQSHNNPTLQSRPAVFTIARSESSDTAATGNMLNNYVSPMLTSTQHQQQTAMAATTPTQYVQQQSPQQQHFSMPAQQQLFNVNTHQESMGNNISAQTAASVPVAHTPADPSPQQMQMLTEAGSVQKCTRENCNKRAIINPDWEDEYCSNECVVIHCRNVFSGWVESNLEARKQ